MHHITRQMVSRSYQKLYLWGKVKGSCLLTESVTEFSSLCKSSNQILIKEEKFHWVQFQG